MLEPSHTEASLCTVNGTKSAEVPMFYNLGFWNETQPIQVTLTKGTNTVV